MNVMVVEDDPTDRKLIIAVLHIGGYRVLEKSSAEDAIDAIIAEPPDVILVDLKLPGMDGLTLARQLKSDPRTRHIPIVAMTAAFEQFTRSDALQAGCDAFLTKPVDTRMLGEQVAETAKRARPMRR